MAVTTHLSTGPGPVPRPGGPGYDPFDELWARLGRPFEAVRTVSALVGLSEREVDRLAGTAVATSPEADRLLDELPLGIRSLATNMRTQAERCVGELRGPVLWSETIAARASSFGQDDVYVCATPSRAYDIDENQVLVAALVAVKDAADRATEGLSVHTDDAVMRAVWRNGLDAGRFANHPSLARVSRVRPNMRQLKRARTGKKRTTYEPALDLLERAQAPFSAADVRALRDERTSAQHQAFLWAVHHLEAQGARLPEIRASDGIVASGPLSFRHPRRQVQRQLASGIVLGPVLMDVPDRDDLDQAAELLALRAGERTPFLVTSEADVDAAISFAVDTVR